MELTSAQGDTIIINKDKVGLLIKTGRGWRIHTTFGNIIDTHGTEAIKVYEWMKKPELK